MDFKKYFCPVCNNKFTDEDDVVVCPECGTPHHRECYFSNGGCFNEDKHNSTENIAESYTNKDYEKQQKAPLITVEIDKSNNGEKSDVFSNNKINPSPSQTPLIGGKHGYLYEIAIEKNQRFYIPRFVIMDKFNKKISWNIMSFISPMAWALYRKMYKLSFLIFAVYTLIFGSVGYFISTDAEFIKANEVCMQENPEYLVDISAYLSGQGDYSLTPAQKKLIEEMDNIYIPGAVLGIAATLPFVIKCLMGLFGTYLYMKKLTKNIDRAEKKGLFGDELKNYLHRKYGTFPFILALIVGFFEVMTSYSRF